MPCSISPESRRHSYLIRPVLSIPYKRRASEFDHDLEHEHSTQSPSAIGNISSPLRTLTSLNGYMKRLKVVETISSPVSTSSRNNDNRQHNNSNSSISNDNLDRLENVRVNDSHRNNHPLTANESSSQTLTNDITKPVEYFFNLEDNGYNRLHICILQHREEEATRIIKMAPSFDYMNIENAAGQTALHLAVISNQPTLVRKLICAGAPVDAVDGDGNTALHLASISGRTDIARHLLRPVEYTETANIAYDVPFQRIPQDMGLTDSQGRTCLDLAKQHNERDIAILLLRSGACLDNFDFNHVTSGSVDDIFLDSSSDENSSEEETSDDEYTSSDFRFTRTRMNSYLTDIQLSIVRK